MLAADSFVLLDPSVEVHRVEAVVYLLQTEIDVGMVSPSGAGILELVRSLAEAPVHVGTLRDEYDDPALVDGLLSSLLAHGFAHLAVSPSTPLETMRAETAERRRPALRPIIEVDLDVTGSVERWPAWRAGDRAPEIRMRARRIADHAAVFERLARRRKAGELRAHHVVVNVDDARCDEPTRSALLRLGAAIEIEGVAWPCPNEPVPGLAELTRSKIATHVVMGPDASILDAATRDRAAAWVCANAVSGVCMRLDALGPLDESAFVEVLEAIRMLEGAVGDVVVVDMPSDEVLLGVAQRRAGPESDVQRRLRAGYLRWRIPIIKTFEGEWVWPQVPEVEAKWVRPEEDLVPNHPELLRLRPGSSIVDVCGGLGRVARRLAPAVGEDGVIISIELRRVMSERARRFACEAGFTTLQFRPGMAQRLPLADNSVDAAVNEWTGVIWNLGLGPAMLNEMARVVRPGGRISVTHRLTQLKLESLATPWVQYPDIYRRVRSAFEQASLDIVGERIWGQLISSIADEKPTDWLEIYLPRLVTGNLTLGSALGLNPDEEGVTVADVYLTLVAEKR